MITLSIPFPPSANRLWRAVNGRNIASKAYRDWMAEAQAMIAQQRPGKVDGPYKVWFHATRPDKRRRDLGNIEKAVSDALVKAGVVADDCLAEQIVLSWKRDTYAPGAPINVIVEAC